MAALLLLASPGAALAGHGTVPRVTSLQSDDVRRLIDAREPVVLVDMRQRAEYRAGHLPGAISLPITELESRFREIPRTGRVVLYCRCPIADIATAFTFLGGQGYGNHAILQDGFDGWLRRRHPIVK